MQTNSQIYEALNSSQTFGPLSAEGLRSLSQQCKIVKLSTGKSLIRPGIIEKYSYLIVSGEIRLLTLNPFNKEPFTIGKATRTEVVGLIDLLRQASCEIAIASTESILIQIPHNEVLNLIRKEESFRNSLQNVYSPCEGASLLSIQLELLNPPPKYADKWIRDQLQDSKNKINQEGKILLSSKIQGFEECIGQEINNKDFREHTSSTFLPIRFWKWHVNNERIGSNKDSQSMAKAVESKIGEIDHEEEFDFEKYGIKESTNLYSNKYFKHYSGRGKVESNLAIIKMIADALDTPYSSQDLRKIIDSAIDRLGSIPLQGMGELLESMGLQTQIGALKLEKLYKVEFPALVQSRDQILLISDIVNHNIHIADPEKGLRKLPLVEARSLWGDVITVLTIKRLADTPTNEFGWGWFTPVIKKFKLPLAQVLLASLFIQLFQLANPLLLQQIIDKVINQSNLSALQVLGAALVAAALFQGLLTAVRTWLMIDTTDRMDLILGSQVIDKLLRLPLRFFEKRPVGELSQRLGELANLRSFLTGTAITSALDLLFATIYILIMLVYSPVLTAVALGTVPIYILIIIFIAPVYRDLIRKQAQFTARTQSHLIETLSGIQTVKAQHFELNSRWRWQERYSGQIAEGFKSVLLGSSAGEVGNFLNQLSSLLILWVGVYLVINGELSLGQLIAFRIIAGYVTGPILRLSSLWQGFQQVSISMERLKDIVDQVPEAGTNEATQISLPPIKGNVTFENINFRFKSNSGPYQIENLSLTVKAGNFIGIVGQSGSGKSTLMKLLPRLYSPETGRIIIDDYDISKVSLNSVRQQIGIVPQDCLLFEGTIRENISMNNPEASTESIVEVAKAAEAHDFIMELSDGYNTMIGERGAGLSGGQRQRIAIARTLLQNPNLLILDEATSALDYDTESNVCRNLQNSLKNKTVFFITHRLSTIKNSDTIILMHNGRIAESGTHEELMRESGRYATLYAHQGDA